MPIEGLHTRRVTKSLLALASYLGQAADIAGGVQASETLKLELEAPSPSLDRVLWKKNGQVSIKQIEAKGTPAVKVYGDHLTHRDEADILVSDVATFKLVGPGGAYFEAKAPVTPKDDGFEATLTFTGTPPPTVGSYEAQVVRSDGQSAVLANACTISRDSTKPGLPAVTGSSSPPTAAT